MRKKLFLLMTVVFALSFTACNDDDDNDVNLIDVNKLPETAQTFVSTYFDQYTVSKVTMSKNENERGSIYESQLQKREQSFGTSVTTKVKVEFDRDGEWTEIESLINNDPLPAHVLELLPAAVVEYVNTKYPNIGIEEIEKKPYGYKVELINDKELLFDKNGDILSDNQAGSNTNNGTATAAIEEFIKTHFPDYTIAYIKNDTDDGQQYKKVYVKKGYANSYKIVFDMNDNWVEVEGDDDLGLAVPESIMQLLPEGISAHINANYPNSYVSDVEKERNSYQVEIIIDYRNDIDLYFDLNGNFLRVDK